MSIILLPILLIGLVAQWLLDKKYRIKGEHAKLSETAGYKSYVWTIVGVGILFFVLIFLYSDAFSPIYAILCLVLLVIRYYFENRYLAHTQRHKATIRLIGVFVILSAVLIVLHVNDLLLL